MYYRINVGCLKRKKKRCTFDNKLVPLDGDTDLLGSVAFSVAGDVHHAAVHLGLNVQGHFLVGLLFFGESVNVEFTKS